MPYSTGLSFNSDLPMDKVIWLYQGSTTSDAYGGWSITIPHKLAAIPFVKGIWTINDWATTWMTNARHADHDYLDISSNLSSDATNVYFNGAITSGNKTINYKLWGVWNESETYSTLAEHTKNLSTNQYIINSDYNYPQLLLEGYLNKGESVDHNLDFIPQCDIWSYEQISANGYGYVQYTDEMFSTSLAPPSVKLTSKSLTLTSQAFMTKIYYRIYAS